MEERSNKEISSLANFFSEYIPYFKKLRKNLDTKENYKALLKTFGRFIRYQKFSKGQIIYKHGDPSDKFAVILTGEIAILITKSQE